jgi:hypothetical protein
MKKLFIALLALVTTLAFAQTDASHFIGGWKCTSDDYEARFIFDDELVLIVEAAVEDPMMELLPWEYVPEDNILIIEGREYAIDIIDDNTFTLLPATDTDKEWMEDLKFKFERLEEEDDGS